MSAILILSFKILLTPQLAGRAALHSSASHASRSAHMRATNNGQQALQERPSLVAYIAADLLTEV